MDYSSSTLTIIARLHKDGWFDGCRSVADVVLENNAAGSQFMIEKLAWFSRSADINLKPSDIIAFRKTGKEIAELLFNHLGFSFYEYLTDNPQTNKQYNEYIICRRFIDFNEPTEKIKFEDNYDLVLLLCGAAPFSNKDVLFENINRMMPGWGKLLIREKNAEINASSDYLDKVQNFYRNFARDNEFAINEEWFASQENFTSLYSGRDAETLPNKPFSHYYCLLERANCSLQNPPQKIQTPVRFPGTSDVEHAWITDYVYLQVSEFIRENSNLILENGRVHVIGVNDWAIALCRILAGESVDFAIYDTFKHGKYIDDWKILSPEELPNDALVVVCVMAKAGEISGMLDGQYHLGQRLWVCGQNQGLEGTADPVLEVL